MSANDRQEGGAHYRSHGKKDLQHWDVVNIFNLDYFQGNITKYVFRHRDKNGIEDLKKARHYLDKYIEILEKKKGQFGMLLATGSGVNSPGHVSVKTVRDVDDTERAAMDQYAESLRREKQHDDTN